MLFTVCAVVDNMEKSCTVDEDVYNEKTYNRTQDIEAKRDTQQQLIQTLTSRLGKSHLEQKVFHMKQ